MDSFQQAQLAQSVEHHTSDLRDVGSNPTMDKKFQILGSSPPIGKSISQNNKRHSITTNFRAHALYQVEITRK